MRFNTIRASTAMVLALFASSALAQQTPERLRTVPQAQILKPICLKPYSFSGPATIAPGYAGDDAEFRFTGARYLRVDSVRAWLDNVPIAAADLGGWTDGDFSWTEMPLENGVAEYNARRQGRLYLDSSAFGKIILYYWGGTAGYSGRIEVRGCLVDKIPPARLKLPTMRDVPRLPPRRLDPGEDVMRKVLPVRQR